MEPAGDLREVIAGWFAALAKGDGTWVDSHISHRAGVRLVGVGPAAWLQGEAVTAFLKAEVAALGGHTKVSVQAVEAYREGSVGWGVAQVNIDTGNGTPVPTRWSGIFRQEDGNWKAVQIHTSVAGPE